MVPLSEHPEFIAASSELNLHVEAESRIQTRLAEINLMLAKFEVPEKDNQVEQALHFAKTGQIAPARFHNRQLEEERAALSQQSEALRRAIEQQREARNALESRLASEASRECLQEHRQLFRKAADALRKLDQVQVEEVALHRRIEQLGYTPTFPDSVRWHLIGTLADPSSLISMRLRELQRQVD